MSKIKPTHAVCGIDFSGARQAGRSMWITVATVSDGKLILDSVAPATEAFAVATDRDAVLPRLVQYISELGDALVGCDFTFSLPSRLLRGGGGGGGISSSGSQTDIHPPKSFVMCAVTPVANTS